MFDEEMRKQFVVTTKSFAAKSLDEIRIGPMTNERRCSRMGGENRIDRIRRGETFWKMMKPERRRRTFLRCRSTTFERFLPFGKFRRRNFFANPVARLGHQNQRICTCRHIRLDLQIVEHWRDRRAKKNCSLPSDRCTETEKRKTFVHLFGLNCSCSSSSLLRMK